MLRGSWSNAVSATVKKGRREDARSHRRADAICYALRGCGANAGYQMSVRLVEEMGGRNGPARSGAGGSEVGGGDWAP